MGGRSAAAEPAEPSRPLWTAAQWLGLLATAALIVGLLLAPTLALTALWKVAIPLLPASFLINPGIWRNVCPLATLGTLANGFAARRALGPNLLPAAGSIGIILLAVLVPARRGVFNADGTALAAVILLVAGAAVGLGAVYDLKAGFCNAVCPVLPVERLYGQRPLVQVPNVRCAPCTMCTARGCLDLAPAKSIAQTLGPARRSHAWLTTPYGVFAAGFPGFVVAYYLTADGPVAALAGVYAIVALCAALSYIATTAVVLALRVDAGLALRGLAAAAVACYYWFAAPIIASTLTLGGPGTAVMRGAAFALLVWWMWKARL